MLTIKSASEVINEIRAIRGIESDSALAEIFGVKQATVAMWRSRNSIPYDAIIRFCAKENISTDKLFLKDVPTKITVKNLESSGCTKEYDLFLDDLFPTRLKMELRGRTIEWLAGESGVEIESLNGIINAIKEPSVEELEAIARSLKINNVRWLAERSTIKNENWTYEFYKKADNASVPSEIFRAYFLAIEDCIERMKGLLKLSLETKLDVLCTACRVHMKESPETKEVNMELITHLLTLANNN